MRTSLPARAAVQARRSDDRATGGADVLLAQLLSELSAQINAEVPLIGVGVGRAERCARARRLLKEVGLADRAEHRPSQLSGAERQRVALARALVAPTAARRCSTGAWRSPRSPWRRRRPD